MSLARAATKRDCCDGDCGMQHDPERLRPDQAAIAAQNLDPFWEIILEACWRVLPQNRCTIAQLVYYMQLGPGKSPLIPCCLQQQSLPPMPRMPVFNVSNLSNASANRALPASGLPQLPRLPHFCSTYRWAGQLLAVMSLPFSSLHACAASISTDCMPLSPSRDQHCVGLGYTAVVLV